MVAPLYTCSILIVMVWVIAGGLETRCWTGTPLWNTCTLPNGNPPPPPIDVAGKLSIPLPLWKPNMFWKRSSMFTSVCPCIDPDLCINGLDEIASYSRRLDSSLSTSYASLIVWKIAGAPLSWFLSGWYFKDNCLYARLISVCVACLSIPSVS